MSMKTKDQPSQSEIESSIYFLKVEELAALSKIANIKCVNSKQGLIDNILNAAFGISKIQKARKKWSKAEISEAEKKFDPDVYMLPILYTNSAEYKKRFKRNIGKHFTFTSYGMNWVKDKWDEGIFPTFEEFETYWQGEYERRSKSDDFVSPKTLQRVNYFRKMKNKGLTQQELEDGWLEERAKQSRFVIESLSNLFRSRNT